MDTTLFRRQAGRGRPLRVIAIAYGIAALASVVAALLTLLLVHYEERGLFVLFYAAVFVSARYGGAGPGILATAVSALAAGWVILPRLHPFQSAARDLVPLLAFVAVSALTTSILAKLRQTTRHLREKEQHLTDREHLLRRVLDTNPNFIFVKDGAGTVLLANEALAHAYGTTVGGLIGQKHRQLHEKFAMNVEEVDQFLKDDMEVIDSGRPKLLVESFTHRDGSVHWYRTNKLPFALDEEHRWVLIISEDITDRKAARDELNKLNADLEKRVVQRTAQLEAANKELEAFSYSISHDLRAPLRAIYGFTQIIQEDYTPQLPAECRRLLEVISTNARRMGALIDDLLSFSKITRTELSHTLVNMIEQSRQVVQELTVLEPQRSTEVSISELPAAKGDPALLRQVWINLIANALKFTRQAPQPAIAVGAQENGQEIVYFVRDNGVGFDMRYAPKLFKVFQRLHKADQFEGTGVGLAIVQRIVHRHGGRVWAESSVNGGATFFFSLPREKSAGTD